MINKIAKIIIIVSCFAISSKLESQIIDIETSRKEDLSEQKFRLTLDLTVQVERLIEPIILLEQDLISIL